MLDNADTDRPRQSAPIGSIVSLARSAGGIYGLIVISGVVVVSRNLTGSSFDGLLVVIATLVVLFIAHAFAATIAHLSDDGTGHTVRQAIGRGARESAGMLVVGIVPIVVLALGVLGLLRPTDAVWLALFVDVLLLGVLGWAIAAARSLKPVVRFGSALATAAFGGVLILLKVLIHH